MDNKAISKIIHFFASLLGLIYAPITYFKSLTTGQKIALLSLLALLAALMFMGCGADDKHTRQKSVTSHELLRKLSIKQEFYKAAIATHQDPSGFIETNQCDSTLFSGLVGTAVPVVLPQAMDSNGKWHRRPLYLPECFASGQSQSTISKDMMMGVLWWGWRTKDLGLLEKTYDYAKANDWVMGEGPAARVIMSPGLRSTLASAIYALGGPDHLVSRSIPVFYSEDNTDFPAHLDVLHILLRGEIFGQITDDERNILTAQAKRQPNNPLFQYAYHVYRDGIQDKATALLLDEKLWPSDRLPTQADRCSAWLPQRDLGPDWEPCEGTAEHHGGDFVFVAGLILSFDRDP